MTEEVYPQAQYIIDDLETLKVLGDSLRMDILETLESADEALTVKQIAARLGLEVNNLYYHIRLLEKHALIVVTRTNVVSGIIEKQYRLRARRFILNQDMVALSATDTTLPDPISLLLEQTRSEIRAGLEEGLIRLGRAVKEVDSLPVNIQKTIAYLTPQQAEVFLQRLDDLIDDLRTYKTDDAAAQAQERYMLMTAFYPTVRRTEDKGAAQDE